MNQLKNTRSNLLALGVKLNLLAEQRLLGEMESWADGPRKSFWKKVKKGKNNDCWQWKGCKTPKGYGQFRLYNRIMRAHRIAWIFRTKKLIGNKFACHSCDNPSCVNPRHIWLGTNRENQKDAVKKGRNYSPIGELAPYCKLKTEQVLEMRKLHKEGLNERRLSERFGVCFQQVNRIIRRQRWKHI